LVNADEIDTVGAAMSLPSPDADQIGARSVRR
jgi:hypothetical protein